MEKIGKILLNIDPVKAYDIAKKTKNNEIKKKAKEIIKNNLTTMRYGEREFSDFSEEDQKKILRYLSCLEGELLDFLKKIKEPE